MRLIIMDILSLLHIRSSPTRFDMRSNISETEKEGCKEGETLKKVKLSHTGAREWQADEGIHVGKTH